MLLYVAYTCQNSFNFITAFARYKQDVSCPRLIWPTLYKISILSRRYRHVSALYIGFFFDNVDSLSVTVEISVGLTNFSIFYRTFPDFFYVKRLMSKLSRPMQNIHILLSVRSLLRPYNVPKMRLRPGLCPGARWGSLRRSPGPPSRLGRGIRPPQTPPRSSPLAPRY